MLSNGRFDQSKDNFTSVSCKGLVVVDYSICPYSSLNLYRDFQVHDLIKSKDIPTDSTIPDHRLLTVEFKQPQRSSKIDSTKQQVKGKSIPKGYMQDSIVLEQLCMLANQLAPENQQVDINLVTAYLNSQKEFSKLVRKTKHCFRRERQLKLLEQQKYKPKLYWNYIMCIGSATQQLPTSVCTPKGEVVTEGNQVLGVWSDYFCSLLNPCNKP